MSRSLLRQLEQIRRSATYDDALTNAYSSSVAEPTISGSLEQDLNVIRTLVKELKGTNDWFGDLGNYFDPSNTDVSNTATKDLNLSNIKNNTLDSKTALVAVFNDNAAAGYSVSGTSTGALVLLNTKYATPVDRRGIPIYASTANAGLYHDEGAVDRIVRVDVIDVHTGNEIEDSNGNAIYARMVDGADYGGSGDGTDVYMRFYADGITTDLTSLSDVTPSGVAFTYPQRKLLSNVPEYEWLRTSFVSSWQGDIELVDDIQNIWAFTGASDDDITATPWDNATGNYSLNGGPSNLKSAIDDLNDSVGDKTYSSTYLTSGQDVSVSLNDLGLAIEGNDGAVASNSTAITTNAGNISGNTDDISDLESAVGSSTGLFGMDYTSTNYVTVDTSTIEAISQLDSSLYSVEQSLNASSASKYVESVATQIPKNTLHVLPYGLTYTPNSTAGREGDNMDIFVDGQLIAADTGVNGVNADRDYAEATTSGIIFRFKVQVGRNITYLVRQ